VTEATRLKQFARFFKSYMGASTLVVAALPIPVGLLELIPVWEQDKGSNSVITSLLCFLLLAFIFFNRHAIARLLFVEIAVADAFPATAVRPRLARFLFALLIFTLIVSAVGCFFYYQYTFTHLDFIVREGLADPADVATLRVKLMALYVGFFAFAEGAFVLMATKEYLQDVLRLSDVEIIFGPSAAMDPQPATPE
jgi:hypothetical protein